MAFACGVPHLSAEAAPSPAGIIIACRAAAGEVDPSFLEIIEFAAELRLARQGFGSRVLDRAESAGLNDPTPVLAAAVPPARYMLLVEVAGNGKQAALHLAWFDAVPGIWTAEITRSGGFDVSFDDLIFGALDELLASVRAASPQAVIDAAPASGQAIVTATGDGLGAPAATVPNAAVAPRPWRFGFGGGPFLSGGEFGRFFKAAGTLSASIGYRLPGTWSGISIGLGASGIAFTAEGPLESGFGLLAPVALEFSFAAEGEGGGYGLHISGGAAWLYMRTKYYGGLSGLLPYAAAGICLTRNFSSGPGLAVDLSYAVALDGPDFIMGFVPSIGLAIPLGKRP
jgi:hypothetical protein